MSSEIDWSKPVDCFVIHVDRITIFIDGKMADLARDTMVRVNKKGIMKIQDICVGDIVTKFI